MTQSHPAELRVGKRVLLVALLSAGCGQGTAPGFASWGFSITPNAVEAALGDSVVLQAAVNGRVPAGAMLAEWRSGQPAVARLDTVAPLGQPVILRAMAPGIATVTVRAIGGDGGVVALPVTVRARP
jgi:hypothetical protein